MQSKRWTNYRAEVVDLLPGIYKLCVDHDIPKHLFFEIDGAGFQYFSARKTDRSRNRAGWST
jgi:hypothetical protein